jgi:hypothetical protein
MIKILAAIIIFGAPFAYIVIRERRLRNSVPEAGAPWPSGAVDFKAVAKLCLVFLIAMGAPVIALSAASYSPYPEGSSLLKVAFKHSGKKVFDCDEIGLIQREGERYRRLLKETKSVKMDIERLSECGRERFPVRVRLSIDNETMIKEAFQPKGLKKDLSSYVYREALLPSGEHEVSMDMHESGGDAPDFELRKRVAFAPGEIRVIRFDDTLNALVIE